ncbi:amino acid permease [Candidatus Uhrbacteria bacterium]|jgi:tyrosine-specific transport protein|nr:amino acid permease [Candidatus Uhrbacteria bacterium]
MVHPNTKLLRSIGMMVGAIVGVGVFGLPYAFSQSGIGIGFLWLIVIWTTLLILQLMLAEVAVQTPGKDRLVGFVHRYIGPKWRLITLIALASGIWGAMLAYMIIGGRFLHILLEPTLGGSEMLYSIIVWVISSYMIHRGLQSAAKLEVVVVAILLFLFLFISLLSIPSINPANYLTINLENVFVPYGVILFSLAGMGIVPEMADVLGKRKKQDLARSVVIAMSIILAIYVFFALAVIGVTGNATTQAAFDGLIPVFGNGFRLISTILGTVTVLSIFMVLGIELQNTFKFDFKLKHRSAWFFTIIVPLILLLSGVTEFISLIGFVGGVFGGFLGILVALTYWNMKRSAVCKQHHCIDFPHVFTWAIIAMFSGGIIYQLASVFLT